VSRARRLGGALAVVALGIALLLALQPGLRKRLAVALGLRAGPVRVVEWSVEPPAPAAPRHALLIVVDTLRADAVARAHTPHLDAFAAAGQAPTRAWSPSTWTAPAVFSLFTGQHVRAHGWNEPFPRFLRRAGETYPNAPATPFLAEVLTGAGFSTAGYYNNALLGAGLGHNRGFARWERRTDREMPAALAAEVAAWPAVGDPSGPRHFVYLHLHGPHSPLKPSRVAAARWRVPGAARTLRGLGLHAARQMGPARVAAYHRAYHAVVEDQDRLFGRILDALGPHRADTAIVFTSDHGEMLGEHGLMGHEHHVFEALTHVPWIGRGGPVRVPATLSTAATADFLTRALGVPATWDVRADAPGPLVSQREGRLAVSPDGRLKGIWGEDLLPGPAPAAFDLTLDPAEDRAFAGPSAEAARAELDAARAGFEAAVPERRLPRVAAPMDADLQATLAALGYMDDPNAGPGPAADGAAAARGGAGATDTAAPTP
jgi:hypothetical protein